MSIYNTAYKTGVITALNGNQMTISGDTLLNTDNGRIVVITSGNARLQHRRFTRVGQVITLSHPWDTSPFLDISSDGRTLDVLPEIGDSVAIAYNISDLISIDPDIVSNGGRSITIAGMTATRGAYIHFENYNIQLTSDTMKIGQGGGMIFGYYGYVPNEDAYFENTCNIIDSTTTGLGGNQWAVNPSNDFGMLDMYGVNLTINATSCFYRTFQNVNNSRDVQNRWFINVYGNFGSRTDGDRSILNITNVGASSNLGVSNVRSAVSRANFSAIDTLQGAYIWLNSAGGSEGRVTFDRLVNISSHLARVAAGSDGFNKVFEILAKKSEVDLIPFFAQISGTSEPNHTLRYGNLINPKFIDAVGDEVSILKSRLYDATNDFKGEELIVDGTFPSTFVRHTDLNSVVGNYRLSDGELFAPYTLRSIVYGKVFTNTFISVEDSFNSNIVMLDDFNIGELDPLTVANYPSQTSLTTLQMYEYAIIWLEEFLTDEQAFLTNIVGDVLETEFSITIDPNATEFFTFENGVITYKLNEVIGSVKSEGEILGTEYITGTFLSQSIDTTISETSGLTFSLYNNISDYNSSSNPIVEDVRTFGFLFSELTSPTLYAAAPIGGTRYQFPITVEQGINTFSAGIAGVLATISENQEEILEYSKQAAKFSEDNGIILTE